MLNFEIQPNTLHARAYPQVIKYMGSKAGIIDFVVEGINRVHLGGRVCDLFSGACSLSGAIGDQVSMVSNDIQAYSASIAHAYLHRLSPAASALTGSKIAADAEAIALRVIAELPAGLEYPIETSLEKFNQIEERNRSLIDGYFDTHYHLFLMNYSGTWWSAQQCAWIDALREVIDGYLETSQIDSRDHAILLTCAMHAMAYASQGTGHYAQYRDAKTTSSMADINIYRQKSVSAYFVRRFDTLKSWNLENVPAKSGHIIRTLDYLDALRELDADTVYADPPYAFVHYSRFYHAIETFVRYDYPELQVKGGSLVKGRYREDRHQSPFSIRSQVEGAFAAMFAGIAATKSQLVLSYSDSALLDLTTLIKLAQDVFGAGYSVTTMSRAHQHMTMGRREDRDRSVQEVMVLAAHR